MPITTTHFSQEEIQALAQQISAYLLPEILEAVKGKTRIAINRLQGEHFTARQAAERLQISVQQIYRLMDKGTIPFEVVGQRGKRISRNVLDRLLAEGGLAK